MKFLEVFRYELEHQLGKPSTWLYALLLFGFAVANAAEVLPLGPVNANAALNIAYDATTTGLIGLIVSAALFGDAALRDKEAGMDPLLFTAPQRTIDHLGGRYLGALSVNALLLIVVPIGYALPTLLGYPDPTNFGPFRLAVVIEPLLILLLPNVALTGAVLFTVAVLSRRVTAVYIMGFVTFMGMLLLADAAGSRVDPSGMGTIASLRGFPDHSLADGIRSWTVDEQNARLLSSSSELLWNRLLWIGVTGLVLVLLHWRFRFAHSDGGGAARWRRASKLEGAVPARAVPLRTTRVTPSFGFSTTARQLFAITRNSLSEAAANAWFAGVLAVCVVWCASLVEQTANGAFDTTTWPATMLVTGVFSRDFLVGLFILVGFYAGELVWKDRDVGVNDIADSAPVGDGTAFAGRLLALIGMGAMMLAAAMLGGILGQVGNDYSNFEPLLYVRVLFGLDFLEIALVAVLVMTVHVVVNDKYLGIVASLMALVIPFAGVVLKHYLLVYDGDAGWEYSDMNGFGPFLAPFLWFKLYSAGWAVMLALLACVMWVRGRESGLRSRLRQARERVTGSLLRTAVVATAVIVTVGGFIFYNTNVLNAFDADRESRALQSEYETRYARFADVVQPTIQRARLRVEIYPGEQAVEISGSFHLVNRSGRRIDSVHVSSHRALATRTISFDREATPVVSDSAHGYRVYALARPLAPGDSIQLSFDVGFRQRGFPNSGIQTDVVENGTHFDRSWLPSIGFQPARVGADLKGRGEEKAHVETIIGTASDQVAVTIGALRREWTENGRRYFHYETETPQSFEAPIFSAKYEVRTERWTDSSSDSGKSVVLSVYHHPGHGLNIDSLVRGMKTSLAYYTSHFGRYDASDLRIIEIPRYGREVRAHPNMVVFSEGHFIARTRERQIDELFVSTAREVAHQWWGVQVRGAADARGGSDPMSEMLAGYSALMVIEKEYGLGAARRVYAALMERYIANGSESADVSIRGVLAMYQLRELVGDDAVNAALRRFGEKHRSDTTPYPSVLDVVTELRAVTPDSLQYLLADLFESNATLWDVKTERVVATPLATGEYQVTLDVVARKVRVDGVGKETEVPMDDLIDVGAFARGADIGVGEPLYLKPHRIRSGRQTISITVPKQPDRAGFDPYHKLIERVRRDNLAPIESSSGSPPPAR